MPTAEHSSTTRATPDEERLAEVLDDALAGVELDGRSVLAAGPAAAAFADSLSARGAAVTPAADAGAGHDTAPLPFGDAAFDVVLSADLVDHSADPERAVRELVRVLAPGGTIVVVWPRAPLQTARSVLAVLRPGATRPYVRSGAPELRRWLTLRGVEPVRERGVQVLTSSRSSARLALHVLVVGRKRGAAPPA